MSRLVISSDSLERSVKIVNAITKGTSNGLPILKHMAMWQDGGALLMGATNLETSCIIELQPKKEYGNGNFMSCPEVKTLMEVIREICTTEVSLSMDEKRNMVIDTDHDDKFTIKDQESMKGFPCIYSVYDEYKFLENSVEVNDQSSPNHYVYQISLDNSAVQDVIDRVVPSCAKSSLRPVLSGVSIDIQESKLKFVGTDSYRLSELMFEEGKGYQMEHGMFCQTIIPSNTLMLIRAVLREIPYSDVEPKILLSGRVKMTRADEEIRSMVTGNIEHKKGDVISEHVELCEFVIDFGSDIKVRIITRTIDGQFPKYEQVIPNKKSHKNYVEFSINSKVLERVVQSAHIFAKDMNNNMKLTFESKNNFFEVETAENSKGKFSKKVSDIEFIKNSDNKIALSTVYLRECIDMMQNQEISVEVFDHVHPAIVRKKGERGREFLHLIMPLRIAND